MRMTIRQLRSLIHESWADQQANAARMQGRGRTGRTERIPTGDPGAMAAYQQWAEDEGHVTPAASSVLATYVLDNSPDYDVMVQLATELNINPNDVRQEMGRQLRERGTS